MSTASMAVSKTARLGSSPSAPANHIVRGKHWENTVSCEQARGCNPGNGSIPFDVMLMGSHIAA